MDRWKRISLTILHAAQMQLHAAACILCSYMHTHHVIDAQYIICVCDAAVRAALDVLMRVHGMCR